METYEDIKLIACDMDGTLLDERSQVPPETFDLVRALDAAGIRFVAASGRRYDTLRAFFEPVADRMDFVASNGAQVFVRKARRSRSVLPCCTGPLVCACERVRQPSHGGV